MHDGRLACARRNENPRGVGSIGEEEGGREGEEGGNRLGKGGTGREEEGREDGEERREDWTCWEGGRKKKEKEW